MEKENNNAVELEFSYNNNNDGTQKKHEKISKSICSTAQKLDSGEADLSRNKKPTELIGA